MCQSGIETDSKGEGSPTGTDHASLDNGACMGKPLVLRKLVTGMNDLVKDTWLQTAGHLLTCDAQTDKCGHVYLRYPHSGRDDGKGHLKESASKNSCSSGGHCHSFQVDFSSSRLLPSSKISSKPGSKLTVMVVPSFSSAASWASRAAGRQDNQYKFQAERSQHCTRGIVRHERECWCPTPEDRLLAKHTDLTL